MQLGSPLFPMSLAVLVSNGQATTHVVDCTLYTVHCTLYIVTAPDTVHCTLPTLRDIVHPSAHVNWMIGGLLLEKFDPES